MNSTNLIEKKNTSSVKRLSRNSKIFKTIVGAIEEKKGEKIISLDLKKIPEAVADFFVIATASNSLQLRAIADFVEFEVKKKCGELPYKVEGKQGDQWILIDYVNIVVHIMTEESRTFYKLREMWNDANITEHN